MKFNTLLSALIEWLADRQLRTRRLAWGLAIGLPYLAVLLLAAISFWPQQRIVVRTGTAGGMSTMLGDHIVDQLSHDDGLFGHTTYESLDSAGDYENIREIEEGKAQVAFAADGLPIDSSKVCCLVPIADSVLHVVVRADLTSRIRSIADLAGKRVYIGQENSGTWALSKRVLRQYGILEAVIIHGRDLTFDGAADALLDNGLDAAFLLTGLQAPAVTKLAESGKCALVPIDRAEGLAAALGYVGRWSIPKGTYEAKSAFPDTSVETLYCRQLLVCSSRLSDEEAFRFAKAASIAKRQLNSKYTLLDVSKSQILAMRFVYPLHPGAQAYFSDAPPAPARTAVIWGFSTVLVGQLAGLFYYFQFYSSNRRAKTLLNKTEDLRTEILKSSGFNLVGFEDGLTQIAEENLALYKDGKIDADKYQLVKECLSACSDLIRKEQADQHSENPHTDIVHSSNELPIRSAMH